MFMINLRRIRKKDVEEIRHVALKTWLFAYKNIYQPKNIRKFVLDYYSKENFEKDFNSISKGSSEFIIAIERSKIVGYIQVSKSKKIWEVTRIYVNPNDHNKGIGTLLIGKIESFLHGKRTTKFIIHPHRKNKIAINFYKKVGFVRDTKRDRGWSSPCFIKHI